MNLVPTDKFDLASVERLTRASNAQIEPYLGDLIDWVADINWPVAYPIATRLRDCGDAVMPHITRVLRGDDDILKYNVIAHIVCFLDKARLGLLMKDIRRIKEHPTEGERREEVTLAAEDAIAAFSVYA